METLDINLLVTEIFEEDKIYRSCVKNILKNIDHAIEHSGNNRSRIGRLLMIRSFVEKQTLANDISESKGSQELAEIAA